MNPMNRLPLICLTIFLTLCVHGRSWAAVSAEKIYVDADHMQANIETGVSVYTGNVKVTQGELVLSGDQIVVIQQNNEVERITVTGKPAHYNHVTDRGEVIEADSEKMVYNVSNNTLVLTINAELKHPEHYISSQKIIYNTLTKVAVAGDKKTADSTDESNRVKITLSPKSEPGKK